MARPLVDTLYLRSNTSQHSVNFMELKFSNVYKEIVFAYPGTFHKLLESRYIKTNLRVIRSKPKALRTESDSLMHSKTDR